MMGKLDRHSDYIDPDTIGPIRESTLQGKFSGIGVQIRKNNTKRSAPGRHARSSAAPPTRPRSTPATSSPHIVREVDSDGKALATPEIIPTKGMTTEDAVKKILGKAGTKVKLVVEREGEDKPLEFNLIRGSVEVETVLGHKRNADDTWNYVIDPENKICYVRLTSFQENTARDLEQLMKKLYKAGIKGFILDLRFNPGGLLDQAVKISDLFIDDGMIVTIKPRNRPGDLLHGQERRQLHHVPDGLPGQRLQRQCQRDRLGLPCKTTAGRSSSARAATARGACRRSCRSKPARAQLKLTTATFWRPSGRNLNKASTSGKDEEEWGVKPDKGYNLPLSVKELNDLQDHQRDREIINRPGGKTPPVNAAFRDRQVDTALDYLRSQIKLANNKGTAKKAGG